GAVGIGNVEGAVSEHRELKARGLRLWNAPSALKEISTLNVRVAGIANNHAADAGPLGPRQTAARLREHGITPAGGTTDAAIVQVNGLVIAVNSHDLTDGGTVSLYRRVELGRGQSS